jgi:hypothetical protein
MTKADLINKINKSINQVPKDVLQDILDYLDQVKSAPANKINLSRNLGKILREDKELLQKLAL